MAHLGLIGTGVMGAALAQNIAEKGHDLVIFGRRPRRLDELRRSGLEQGLPGELTITLDLQEFVTSMQRPRSVLCMVTAGSALDEIVESLVPLLDSGDLIADLGNSHFSDTERRAEELESAGIMFAGIGVSGGAEGARHGPAIMAGGTLDGWKQIRTPLTDIAARHEGEPCCGWFGTGGAGHFVKMLHNGIEYADMQLIAEAYGIMRDGLGMTASEMAEVFGKWMKGPLNSYLIEISSEVAAAIDEATGRPVLEEILDRAGQKGTGRWSAVEALHLASPAGMIHAAVDARVMSSNRELRLQGEEVLGNPLQRLGNVLGNRADTVSTLGNAMMTAKICAYVQGFELLEQASRKYGWDLDLAAVARVWRAGCIIRSAFLDDLAQAFENCNAEQLLFSPLIRPPLERGLPSLRRVVSASVASGIPVPSLFAALSHLDARRIGRSTANMIQGLRDYFGAHTFERVDAPGEYVNGPWHS